MDDLCEYFSKDGHLGYMMGEMAPHIEAEGAVRLGSAIGKSILDSQLKLQASDIAITARNLSNSGHYDDITTNNLGRISGAFNSLAKGTTGVTPSAVAKVYVERDLGVIPCAPS